MVEIVWEGRVEEGREAAGWAWLEPWQPYAIKGLVGRIVVDVYQSPPLARVYMPLRP
jgi:hypothetical protein